MEDGGMGWDLKSKTFQRFMCGGHAGPPAKAGGQLSAHAQSGGPAGL